MSPELNISAVASQLEFAIVERFWKSPAITMEVTRLKMVVENMEYLQTTTDNGDPLPYRAGLLPLPIASKLAKRSARGIEAAARFYLGGHVINFVAGPWEELGVRLGVGAAFDWDDVLSRMEEGLRLNRNTEIEWTSDIKLDFSDLLGTDPRRSTWTAEKCVDIEHLARPGFMVLEGERPYLRVAGILTHEELSAWASSSSRSYILDLDIPREGLGPLDILDISAFNVRDSLPPEIARADPFEIAEWLSVSPILTDVSRGDIRRKSNTQPKLDGLSIWLCVIVAISVILRLYTELTHGTSKNLASETEIS